MDFILAPADPERQRALPETPAACPQCGACAWRRNGTYVRDLVVLGRLQVQRWQCKACLGSASPLPPGVTALQRPQAFRELVTSLYVHSVRFRGLVRIMDLLGRGVGPAQRPHPMAARGKQGRAAGLGSPTGRRLWQNYSRLQSLPPRRCPAHPVRRSPHSCITAWRTVHVAPSRLAGPRGPARNYVR